MKKYHINPETGWPGICRARNGNCPYGGETGQENHFDTYEEAQAESQRMLSEKHGILPPANQREELEYKQKLEEELKKLIGYINKTDDEVVDDLELKYKIRTSDDPKMLLDVINGNLHVKKEWETIGPALQNQNVPREFINDVLKNPDDYELETQRWVASNPGLTHKELINIVNTNKDLTTRTLALRNPSLDKKFALDLLEKYPDKLAHLPWYGITKNSVISNERVFRDWEINAFVNSVEFDTIGMLDINKNYPDWKVFYDNQSK